MTDHATAPERSGWITQAETISRLGFTDGMLAGCRRRTVGPKSAKFDYQEPYSYEEISVGAIRAALVGIGMYGLKLHSAASPLSDEGSAPISGDAIGPLMPEGEMLQQLGISKRIAAGWRGAGIGPRCTRTSYSRPYDYQANDVAELRQHLLSLGTFGLCLPGVAALKQ